MQKKYCIQTDRQIGKRNKFTKSERNTDKQANETHLERQSKDRNIDKRNTVRKKTTKTLKQTKRPKYTVRKEERKNDK